MLTKAEKLIILGITAFIAANILLFLSDLSSETIGMIYVGGILIITAVFAVHLFMILNFPKNYGKNAVEIEITGGSNKDVISLFIDGKLTERFIGMISDCRFKCRPGEHAIMVQYKGNASSAKIDTSEKRAKVYVSINSSEISMRTEQISEITDAEKPSVDRLSGTMIWLVFMIMLSLLVCMAIMRILVLAGFFD